MQQIMQQMPQYRRVSKIFLMNQVYYITSSGKLTVEIGNDSITVSYRDSSIKIEKSKYEEGKYEVSVMFQNNEDRPVVGIVDRDSVDECIDYVCEKCKISRP